MAARRKQLILLVLVIIVILICVAVEFDRITPMFRLFHSTNVRHVDPLSASQISDSSSSKRKDDDMSTTFIADSQRLYMAEQSPPKDRNTDSSDRFMESHRRIQEQRRSQVQHICQVYHKETRDVKEILTDFEKYHGSLLVDDKHKILHCNTPKIAGTSWKRVLNVLTGNTNSTSEGTGYENVDIARKIRRLATYTPSEIDHILQTYTKFMFARHPFSRILSAFNNKLAPNSTDTRNRQIFRDAIGEVIQLVYHPCAYSRTRKTKCEYNVTFHDFVRFLIDPKMEPFQGNIHWKTNYEICKPCDIHYDIIGKYETLADDAKYVLKVAKVDHLVKFPTNEGNAATSTHSSDQRKLLDSYKMMTLEEIQSLVRFYKMDFLLFDYPVATSEEFARFLHDRFRENNDGVSGSLKNLKGIRIF